MTAKHLEVFRSMGTSLGVGWERDDIQVIHLFANVKPGEKFQPTSGPDGGPHWPCEVCDHHGYSEADFLNQIHEALKRGPVDD